jgi:hypothetical protein
MARLPNPNPASLPYPDCPSDCDKSLCWDITCPMIQADLEKKMRAEWVQMKSQRFLTNKKRSLARRKSQRFLTNKKRSLARRFNDCLKVR